MSNVNTEVRKLAIELYDGALARDEHFNPEHLAERLVGDLHERYRETGRSVVDDLIRSAAYNAIREVDHSRTRAEPHPSLLEDLDRAIPVSEQQRIARRHMRQDDWNVHLTHVSANASRVAAAAAKEYTRHTALSPYLATGITTEEALEAWQADNPDEVLA